MQEIIIVGSIIGLIASFWGITWKLGDDMGKKVSRVYERLDEYKAHLESTHVRREICDIMHQQLRQDVGEIKKDVKELVKIANNGKV